MTPIYQTFHRAMEVEKERISAEPYITKAKTHWTQHAIIAGSTVATIATIALVIFTQHPLAIVAGVICLANLITACYLKKFSSPETVKFFVDALAQKVKILHNDVKGLKTTEAEIKAKARENADLQSEKSALQAEFNGLKKMHDEDIASISQMEKQKNQINSEKAALNDEIDRLNIIKEAQHKALHEATKRHHLESESLKKTAEALSSAQNAELKQLREQTQKQGIAVLQLQKEKNQSENEKKAAVASLRAEIEKQNIEIANWRRAINLLPVPSRDKAHMFFERNPAQTTPVKKRARSNSNPNLFGSLQPISSLPTIFSPPPANVKK